LANWGSQSQNIGLFWCSIHSHTYFISYKQEKIGGVVGVERKNEEDKQKDNEKEGDHIEALLFRQKRVVKRDKAVVGIGDTISEKIERAIDTSDTFLALWFNFDLHAGCADRKTREISIIEAIKGEGSVERYAIDE
jgi:hypothetical protein